MSIAIIFSSIIGIFVFDGDYAVKKVFHVSDEEALMICNGEWTDTEKKAVSYSKEIGRVYLVGFKNSKVEGVTLTTDPEKISRIRDLIAKNHKQELQEANYRLSAKTVANSVGPDSEIVKAIYTYDDIEKNINGILKRLADWMSLYNPELSFELKGNIKLAEFIIDMKGDKTDKPHDEKDAKSHIVTKDGAKSLIGAELKEEAYLELKEISSLIVKIAETKQKIEEYIKAQMKEHYPNIETVAGPMLGGKLISLAGSVRRLAELPASTIQLLGAEKALFRHMKTGAKPPKHGVIIQHPIVSAADEKERGKRARSVADAIAIATRVDFYNGQFIGDKLKEKLEMKFKWALK